MEITAIYGGAADTMELSGAVLLYSNGQMTLATLHAVETTGGDTPRLLPGIPLDKTRLLEIIERMEKRSLSRQILPECLLIAAPDCLVWYRPSQRREIYVDTRDAAFNRDLNGHEVTHPALVFIARQSKHGVSLSVFALGSDRRPDAQASLYRAPYFNVYESGRLCEGTYLLPKDFAPSAIGDWEKAFFSTSFTHSNMGDGLCNHPHGHNALWRAMLASDAAFDSAWLKPLEKTLGDVAL